MRSKKRSQVHPLDRFAELISQHDCAAGNPGPSVRDVAAAMGITYQAGYSMLQRIRRGLGEQAV